MQPEIIILLKQELSLLTSRYHSAMGRDEPFESVRPLLTEIRQKKKQLEVHLNIKPAGTADHANR